MILQASLISCAMLTGLIWLVQIVHYPSFLFIDIKEFSSFHVFHSQRITWIVAPLMVIELITAIMLAWDPGGWFFHLSLGLVLIVWVSTVFVSVPIHAQLKNSNDRSKIQLLIRTNWIRTLFWTMRLSLLIFYIAQYPDSQKVLAF